MKSNFQKCITLTFGHEGGYVNHPQDPGGATKYGITAATLGAWRHLGRRATPDEVKALALSEAAQILEKQYANPVRFDDLPAGLDYCVFDYAVNSGPMQAIRTLQRVLKCNPDGNLGAGTLAAIAKHEHSDLIIQYCAARLVFMKTLHTWKTFGKGWQTRVDGVERAALAMARGAPALSSPAISGTHSLGLMDSSLAKAEPSERKVTSTTQGKGVVATAIGTATGTISPIIDSTKDALLPASGSGGIIDKVLFGLTIAGVALAVVGIIMTAFGQAKAISNGTPG